MDEAGAPRVRAFVVDAAPVRRHADWRSVGMRSSGTHSFSLAGAWVPEGQAFDIRPEAATDPGTLYRFPFTELAWVTLAANLSGMALAFLHAAEQRARAAGRDGVLALVRTTRDGLWPVRARALDTLDSAWAQLDAGEALDPVCAADLRARSAQLVHTARRAVDEVYPACGLLAAHEDSRLNRIWRDLHTATQHAMLRP